MEQRPRIIATVINDVVYDQRMIRICTSLSNSYEVALWGRKKSRLPIDKRPYQQRRFSFLINKGPFFYLAYNIRIFISLLFTPFDIVHAVDLDTLLGTYLASKFKGKKLILDAHEYFTEVPELHNRPTQKKIWLILERYLVPKVNSGITVSHSIAREYKELYQKEFSVILNCPNVQSYETKKNPLPYIIYQGALNKGRGLEALILAMKEIPLDLKIAGSGDIEDKLRLLVKRLQLENKIEFLGMFKPTELPSITQQAFLGYNAMENLGLSYYYSLSNKFFDYIHAGVPVITNSFPEYDAINKMYNCCIYSEADSKQLASVINQLIKDHKMYKSLKTNCIKASKSMNWKIEEAKLIEFYNKLFD